MAGNGDLSIETTASGTMDIDRISTAQELTEKLSRIKNEADAMIKGYYTGIKIQTREEGLRYLTSLDDLVKYHQEKKDAKGRVIDSQPMVNNQPRHFTAYEVMSLIVRADFPAALLQDYIFTSSAVFTDGKGHFKIVQMAEEFLPESIKNGHQVYIAKPGEECRWVPAIGEALHEIDFNKYPGAVYNLKDCVKINAINRYLKSPESVMANLPWLDLADGNKDLLEEFSRLVFGMQGQSQSMPLWVVNDDKVPSIRPVMFTPICGGAGADGMLALREKSKRLSFLMLESI